MPRLWIHIGSHKTGTTSIQKTMSGSRDVLRAAGLTYPWNQLWFPDDPGTKPRGYDHRYLASEANAYTLKQNLDAIYSGFDGDEWIVSSELLSAIQKPAVEHLVDALSTRFDDIRAVMYVREPGALVVSASATHIVMGQTTYEAACEQPRIFRYRRIMTPWLERLGKERFCVRVFDRKRLHNESVVDDLLAVMGREEQAIALNRATQFVTPSHDAVLAMSERNARGEGHLRGGRWGRIPGPAFTLPPAVIETVRRESADDVAWLKQTFGLAFRRRPACSSA